MPCIEKRIAKDGTISFRAKVKLSGFRPQSGTFAKRADARDWALNLESDIRAGRFGADNGCILTDGDKYAMLLGGEWRPEAPFTGATYFSGK